MLQQNFDKRSVDFFKGVSDYFSNLTSKNGRLICYKHVATEHSGKNIYSAVIDSKLYELTGEIKYYERAKSRVMRTANIVVRDPEFGYWTFFPGRFGKRNMSNVVVDAGACLDVLSNFYSKYGDRLSVVEKDKIKYAIIINGDTFLSERGLNKDVTNQRLWGGTGLACAYRIFKKEEWRDNLIKAISKSFGEMWSDGTFPYHPYWEKNKVYKGIYDTNPYYQSRCIDFIYYILENIGIDANEYKEQLVRATDSLVASYQPNGIKNMNLECKRWYWNSNYEVGSNTFDIYALVKTYKLTGDKIYAYYAREALKQVFKHVLEDGGVTSHLDSYQNNFKCRIFWNAHLAWLLRAIEEAPGIQNEEYEADDEFKYFENSGICKFKNKNYSCILRGKKQPMSLMWGPSVGGGSMLYFGVRKNAWVNILNAEGWRPNFPGNFQFNVKEKYIKNLIKFIIRDAVDIKSKLYHISVEMLARRLRTSMTLLCKLAWMTVSWSRDIFTSHWAVHAVVQKQSDGIIFNVAPSNRGGEELAGVKIQREYSFESCKLNIKEKVDIDTNRIERVRYNKIPGAADFKIITELKYAEFQKFIIFYPDDAGSHLEINYSLCAE